VFGSLTWADDGGIYSVRSPIAIYPTDASSPTLFTKSVDADTASAGDTLTYEINVSNGPLTGPLTVTDAVPAGTTFVPGSETESVSNGSTTSPWSYDAGSNSLTWEGELDPSLIEVADIGPITNYVSLASIGVPPFGFPSNCDDGAWAVNVAPFTYNNATYSSVIFSVNGTLEAGTASGVATSFANQNLPDPTTPNNILAPFWRDLDGCAGGELYVASLNFGGGYVFTVFEWEDIPFFGSTDAVTMQVYLRQNTAPTDVPEAWFTYGRLDNTNDGGTVGAENADGTVGSSYFYNGAGTAPEVDTDVSVFGLPGGSATLGFQVEADCSVNVINQADLSSEAGDESALAITTCP
jgi:uncharacterized repeat protein (TIGR01451 family)